MDLLAGEELFLVAIGKDKAADKYLQIALLKGSLSRRVEFIINNFYGAGFQSAIRL